MAGSARAGGIERLLYGEDPTPRIVAVEAAGSAMRLYRRLEGDRVESAVEPFEPWLLLDREPIWPRLRGEYGAERLRGEARYRWLIRFRTWSAFGVARDLLEADGEPWAGFRSPVEQY